MKAFGGIVVTQSTPAQPWKVEVCVGASHLAPCVLSREMLMLLGWLAVLRMEILVVGEACAPFLEKSGPYLEEALQMLQ